MKTTLTAEQMRERYNRAADQYRARATGLKGEYYRRFEDALFLRHVDFAGKRVLDLGTGRGRLALLAAETAREVVGLDLSDEMIRQAREEAGARPNVRFECADAARLACADGAFDAVVSAGMFPYIREVRPFFDEIHRVLVPGGTFAFSAFNAREWTLDARLYARVTGGSLERREDALVPHDATELERELRDAGFEPFARRSTFFFLPSRIFFWAGRRAMTRVCDAAARANAALGAAPITRERGKVMVLFARKR